MKTQSKTTDKALTANNSNNTKKHKMKNKKKVTNASQNKEAKNYVDVCDCYNSDWGIYLIVVCGLFEKFIIHTHEEIPYQNDPAEIANIQGTKNKFRFIIESDFWVKIWAHFCNSSFY